MRKDQQPKNTFGDGDAPTGAALRRSTTAEAVLRAPSLLGRFVVNREHQTLTGVGPVTVIGLPKMSPAPIAGCGHLLWHQAAWAQ